MHRLTLACVVLLMTTACGGDDSLAPAPVATDVTHYANARLIIGDGNAPIEDGAFVVEDGRFTAVGSAIDVTPPEGAAYVDLGGQTVMPVMHSLHVHVGYLSGRQFSADNYTRESILDALDRYLYYGIGSVLVTGTDAGDTAFQIRDDQRLGRAGGATLFTVGRGITAEGGWPTTIAALSEAPQQVTTEAEAREAVQQLAERNVDMIKVWVDDVGGQIPKIAPELYGAVIDEARQHALSVIAHVFYADDAKALVEAGIRGLVHSIRDREIDDELVELMRTNGVFYLPTLSAHETAFSYGEQPAWVGEPAMRESVPASLVDFLASEEFVSGVRDNPNGEAVREEYRIAEVNLKRLSDGGVRIGLGTDSGTTNRFPGYFEHREIELMVQAGMSPADAIVAATRVSAEILGLESGTLAAGHVADFIVLPDDPLKDITATRRIAEVGRAGEYVDRDHLSSRFVGSMP